MSRLVILTFISFIEELYLSNFVFNCTFALGESPYEQDPVKCS